MDILWWVRKNIYVHIVTTQTLNPQTLKPVNPKRPGALRVPQLLGDHLGPRGLEEGPGKGAVLGRTLGFRL